MAQSDHFGESVGAGAGPPEGQRGGCSHFGAMKLLRKSRSRSSSAASSPQPSPREAAPSGGGTPKHWPRGSERRLPEQLARDAAAARANDAAAARSSDAAASAAAADERHQQHSGASHIGASIIGASHIQGALLRAHLRALPFNSEEEALQLARLEAAALAHAHAPSPQMRSNSMRSRSPAKTPPKTTPTEAQIQAAGAPAAGGGGGAGGGAGGAQHRPGSASAHRTTSSGERTLRPSSSATLRPISTPREELALCIQQRSTAPSEVEAALRAAGGRGAAAACVPSGWAKRPYAPGVSPQIGDEVVLASGFGLDRGRKNGWKEGELATVSYIDDGKVHDRMVPKGSHKRDVVLDAIAVRRQSDGEELSFFSATELAVPIGGVLPLHFAAIHRRDTAVVRLLLQAFPQAAAATDSKGRLPLSIAVEAECDPEVVAMLKVATMRALRNDIPQFHAVLSDADPKDEMWMNVFRGVSKNATAAFRGVTLELERDGSTAEEIYNTLTGYGVAQQAVLEAMEEMEHDEQIYELAGLGIDLALDADEEEIRSAFMAAGVAAEALHAPLWWDGPKLGEPVALAEWLREKKHLKKGQVARVKKVEKDGKIDLRRLSDGETLFFLSPQDLAFPAEGLLPLHYACALGRDSAILKVLFEAYPPAATTKDTLGRLPVEIARECGATDEALAMLNAEGIAQKEGERKEAARRNEERLRQLEDETTKMSKQKLQLERELRRQSLDAAEVSGQVSSQSKKIEELHGALRAAEQLVADEKTLASAAQLKLKEQLEEELEEAAGRQRDAIDEAMMDLQMRMQPGVMMPTPREQLAIDATAELFDELGDLGNFISRGSPGGGAGSESSGGDSALHTPRTVLASRMSRDLVGDALSDLDAEAHEREERAGRGVNNEQLDAMQAQNQKQMAAIGSQLQALSGHIHTQVSNSEAKVLAKLERETRALHAKVDKLEALRQEEAQASAEALERRLTEAVAAQIAAASAGLEGRAEARLLDVAATIGAEQKASAAVLELLLEQQAAATTEALRADIAQVRRTTAMTAQAAAEQEAQQSRDELMAELEKAGVAMQEAVDASAVRISEDLSGKIWVTMMQRIEAQLAPISEKVAENREKLQKMDVDVQKFLEEQSSLMKMAARSKAAADLANRPSRKSLVCMVASNELVPQAVRVPAEATTLPELKAALQSQLRLKHVEIDVHRYEKSLDSHVRVTDMSQFGKKSKHMLRVEVAKP